MQQRSPPFIIIVISFAQLAEDRQSTRTKHAQVRRVRAADCRARRGATGCILHCLRGTPVRSVLRPAPPPAAAAWRRGSGARRWHRRIHSGPGTAFAKEEASNAVAPGVCRARCLARRRLVMLISLVACGVRRPGVKAVLSRQQHETARLVEVAEPSAFQTCIGAQAAAQTQVRSIWSSPFLKCLAAGLHRYAHRCRGTRVAVCWRSPCKRLSAVKQKPAASFLIYKTRLRRVDAVICNRLSEHQHGGSATTRTGCYVPEAALAAGFLALP